VWRRTAGALAAQSAAGGLGQIGVAERYSSNLRLTIDNDGVDLAPELDQLLADDRRLNPRASKQLNAHRAALVAGRPFVNCAIASSPSCRPCRPAACVLIFGP
jgi:hypothetical protein